MEIGFTGTRLGMTTSQKLTVVKLLQDKKPSKGKHGMCVGADKDFDDICARLHIRRQGWPGVGADGTCSTRACCHGIEEIMGERRYQVRDRLIVATTEELIATPKGFHEEFRGSGTWLTIRIAWSLGHPCHIVFPDGTIADPKR